MTNNKMEGARINWPEPSPSLIPDGPLMEAVLAAESPGQLRKILQDDVARRAWVHADEIHPFNSKRPFIVYEPMNRKPEKAIAIAAAELACLELGIDSESEFLLTGIPRSATWIAQAVMEKKIFPNARQVMLTKNPEEIPSGVEFSTFEVTSYVHNRREDGSRGTETVYMMTDPTQIDGAHLLVMEDVIAQGPTVNEVARKLKELGARQVDIVAILSKGLIQGGTKAILDAGLVDNLVEAVRVAKVRGPGPAKEQLVFDV